MPPLGSAARERTLFEIVNELIGLTVAVATPRCVFTEEETVIRFGQMPMIRPLKITNFAKAT